MRIRGKISILEVAIVSFTVDEGWMVASGGGVRRCDINVKHDIELLGRLDDGLRYYRLVYNGGHTAYVGVIVQEVLNVMPGAVSRGSEGYLCVSYDLLGLPFESYDQWVATGARLPNAKSIPH